MTTIEVAGRRYMQDSKNLWWQAGPDHPAPGRVPAPDFANELLDEIVLLRERESVQVAWTEKDGIEVITAKDPAIEVLADAVHEMWSHWMRYLRNKGALAGADPRDVRHWHGQMTREYADLMEDEKESDREVVRDYLLPVLRTRPAVQPGDGGVVREHGGGDQGGAGAHRPDGQEVDGPYTEGPAKVLPARDAGQGEIGGSDG